MRKPILLFSFFLFSFTAFSQFTVHTLAGKDSAGFRNGTDSNSLFNSPVGVAADNFGNVYVADYSNNLIRKISGGVTSTLAGDTNGFINGTGTSALFNRPIGICVDSLGNVYVADTYNNAIRKITSAGVVSTVSGKGLDSAGYRNGSVADALFYQPVGVAMDKNGNIFVADNGNNVVREISTSGMVSTYAGNDTIGYRNGSAGTAEFDGLAGITVDRVGNVYVTEIVNNAVREISNGIVYNIGGFDTTGADTTITTVDPGFKNGAADTSVFYNPTGIIVDDSGTVYVCDEYNNMIRQIKKGFVSTFAGNGKAGFVNGDADSAEFYFPVGIAMDNKGNFYIGENGNNVVREIYPPGIAGIKPVADEKPHVLTYPNPCNAQVTIVSSTNGLAELLDITGRVVWSRENFKSPYTLATDDISPGMYFLRISANSQAAISRVVVAH